MASTAPLDIPLGLRRVAEHAQSEQQGGRPTAARTVGPQGGPPSSAAQRHTNRQTNTPERSDTAARNLVMQQLQEQICRATNSIRDAQASLASKGSSTAVASTDVQAFLHKIQQLRAQLDTLIMQKKRMQSQSTDTQPEVSQVQAAIKVPPIQANTCQQVQQGSLPALAAHHTTHMPSTVRAAYRGPGLPAPVAAPPRTAAHAHFARLTATALTAEPGVGPVRRSARLAARAACKQHPRVWRAPGPAAAAAAAAAAEAPAGGSGLDWDTQCRVNAWFKQAMRGKGGRSCTTAPVGRQQAAAAAPLTLPAPPPPPALAAAATAAAAVVAGGAGRKPKLSRRQRKQRARELREQHEQREVQQEAAAMARASSSEGFDAAAAGAAAGAEGGAVPDTAAVQQQVQKFAGFETFSTGIGSRLLSRWGWSEGQGLGKAGQGMAEPLHAQPQPRQLGLGAEPQQQKKQKKKRKPPQQLLPPPQQQQPLLDLQQQGPAAQNSQQQHQHQHYHHQQQQQQQHQHYQQQQDGQQLWGVLQQEQRHWPLQQQQQWAVQPQQQQQQPPMQMPFPSQDLQEFLLSCLPAVDTVAEQPACE